MPSPMHTIRYDMDHVAKIREAAIRRVDKDTNTFRPSILSKLHLHASPSPRKIIKVPVLTYNLNNDVRPIFCAGRSTRRRRPGTSREQQRRQQERVRVSKAKALVLEAQQDEQNEHKRNNSTSGERTLATSIRRAHEVLLKSYTKSIKTTRALEAEQLEWRHQSPAKRGLNTSPKGTWSTTRGKRITALSSISTSKLRGNQVRTTNPPVFNSDNVLRLSPHASRYSTTTYGSLIAHHTPRRRDRDRVIRKIGF